MTTSSNINTPTTAAISNTETFSSPVDNATTSLLAAMLDSGLDLRGCGLDIRSLTLDDLTACLNSIVRSQVMDTEEGLSDLAANLDMFFLVLVGIIIYLMQGGFALLECGAVRAKNATNILTKNMLDSFMGAISYWIIGWALAFGKGNLFCGTEFWALSYTPDNLIALWFFHFVFAATAATIVSGAVAERCEFAAYVAYSILITGVMYPIVTHWAWSEYGWLNQGFEYEYNNQIHVVRFQDFAGSGVVHLLGGTASLVAAIFLGPRIGRFDDDGLPKDIRGHSMPLTALGGFILFFGFFAFNGGSEATISVPGAGVNIARAVVNTILSASSAGLTCLITCYLRLLTTSVPPTFSLGTTINGGLAGMVAICAGCNAYYPWAAAITGAIAGLSYMLWSALILKLRIDDPLDAVAVHGGGGLWGLIAVPFLKTDGGIIFNWDKPSAMALGINLAGALAIIAWSGALSILLFAALRGCNMLRVEMEVETKGLDVPKHGEPAYPLDSYGDGWQFFDVTQRRNSKPRVSVSETDDKDKDKDKATESRRCAHPLGLTHMYPLLNGPGEVRASSPRLLRICPDESRMA